MIPVKSILEVNETWGSLGFSYLSMAFGNGVTPQRRTYIPVRDERGILISQYFVAAEAL
jgi:hypothetical protein